MPGEDTPLTDDVLDVLSRLVDKSLVSVDSTGDEARYRLLEIVRHLASIHRSLISVVLACG